MLRKVQNPGEIAERLQVLLRLSVFNPAHLSLRETKPAAEQLLIHPAPEDAQMCRMVAVRLEYLAYVLACESGPEFVGLEELVPELCGRGPKLVALLSMTFAAQTRRVVGGDHRATAGAAATVATRPACRLPESNHSDPPSELHDTPDHVHRDPKCHQRMNRAGQYMCSTWRYADAQVPACGNRYRPDRGVGERWTRSSLAPTQPGFK